MTAAHVIAKAKTLIGNKGGELFWRAYGYTNRVAWCCIFCWYLFQDDPALFYNGGKTAYVPALWDWAKKAGLIQAEPQPGDMVVYDWNNNGGGDHVGLVVGVHETTIDTIEGNVDDQVKALSRSRAASPGYKIMGYIRPLYTTNDHQCSPDTCPIMQYLRDLLKNN